VRREVTIPTALRHRGRRGRADGRQLLAALDYLTGSSSVRTRIDPNRLAVAGHSMGGGGTLEAARTRPSLPTARQMVAWLKRFVDDDTRYDQFICPGPSGSSIEEYRSTCPIG
jgi:dienelactone hydrolase